MRSSGSRAYGGMRIFWPLPWRGFSDAMLPCQYRGRSGSFGKIPAHREASLLTACLSNSTCYSRSDIESDLGKG